MYELFKDRENELVNALIHRVDNNQVYVELGGTTALLPAREQISTEQYYGGQRIKLYLDKVIKTTKGPQLLISRTHPKLVEKLMELEIPEVKAEPLSSKVARNLVYDVKLPLAQRTHKWIQLEPALDKTEYAYKT
jgi:N utilization substance protein A